MCDNFETTKLKKFEGFKVVAKKGKKYYSLLTGNAYPQENEDIPEWFDQSKQIADNFYVKDILPGSKKEFDKIIKENGAFPSCWEQDMIGRTGAFKVLANATLYLRSTKGYDVKKGFTVVIVKVELSKDLLSADYGGDIVYVGKRMKVLEEVG
jgi:hypothetical protein